MSRKSLFFALIVALGPIVTGIAWTFAYFGKYEAGRRMLADSDILYGEQVFLELFERGGHLSEWSLTPAPYFVDLIGYFAIRPLAPNVYWAVYLFTLIQLLVVLALAMGSAYVLTGSRAAVFLTQASCMFGLFVALGDLHPYVFIYFPTYHVGNLIFGAAIFSLSARMLSAGGGPKYSLLLTCLVAVGTASDLFLLVTFLFPLCLTLLVHLVASKPCPSFLKDSRVRVIALTTLGSVLGILLARAITIKTSPPLFGASLAEVVQSVQSAPSKVVRLFWVCPTANLFLCAFYLLMIWRCLAWARSPKTVRVSSFPLWELLLLLSSFGLMLFLILRDMLHFPDPDTSRYLLTASWLPLMYVWVAFRDKLDWSHLNRLGLFLVVLASVLLLGRSYQPVSRLQTEHYPNWAKTMDAHLEQVEKMTGRDMSKGVSTYWPAKMTMTNSRRQGLQIAQYTSNLSPYLWITTTRWFSDEYDFALVRNNEEDELFLKNLIESCGPPAEFRDCEGKFRLAIFPKGKLKLGTPMGPVTKLVSMHISAQGSIRLPRSEGIRSPKEFAQGTTFVFGPYVKLAPNRYQVELLLECEPGTGNGVLLCEVVTDQGSEILASQRLLLEEWPSSGQQLVSLTFEVDESAREKLFEFRLWKEGAYTVTLRQIELDRL